MSRSLLFLSVLAVLFLTQLTAVQSQQCAFCSIGVCSAVLPNVSSVSLQIPDTALGTGAQFCVALNLDLNQWVSTAPSTSCKQQVTAYACQVMYAVNQTETNCNVSSIGNGVANFSQSFTLGCQSELQCLSNVIGTEFQQLHACDNFTAFLDALPVMAALIPPQQISSTAGKPITSGATPVVTGAAVLWSAAVASLVWSIWQ